MQLIYAHTHDPVNALMRSRLCVADQFGLDDCMPMDLAKLLSEYRQRRGFTQEDLADRLDVTQSTVVRWEKGAKPRPDALRAIAREMGISVDELVANPDFAGKVQTSGPLLPVKGVVAAGLWVEAYETPADDWESFTGRPDVVASNDHRFGLKVIGDSMNEFYPEGTILDCVSSFGHAEPLPGKRVVIVRTRAKDGRLEATCKELVDINGEMWARPRSTNPSHQAFKIDEPGDDISEVRIVAVVVGSYRPE